MIVPPDDEALQSDVYLELLLDSHRGGPRSASADLAWLDPEVQRTAELLDRTLVRFHPSFRFEEALAGRLRGAAAVLALPEGMRGIAIAFPPGRRKSAVAQAMDPVSRDAVTVDALAREALNRVLVGGAIASGVSIAGAAAWFVWRRRSRQETLA